MCSLVMLHDPVALAAAVSQRGLVLFVQGRLFSVPGLLADEALGREYQDCSMIIFRLAPQGPWATPSHVSLSLCSLWTTRHLIHSSVVLQITTDFTARSPVQLSTLPCQDRMPLNSVVWLGG